MLLAGGVVQEFTPAGEFFAQPRSEAGRQFLRTGGVVTANIGVPSRHLRSDLREVPAGLGLDGTKGNANGLQSVFDGKLFIYTACTDGPSATVDVDFLRNEGVTSVVFVDGEEPSEIKAIEDPKGSKSSGGYGADSITVLEGLEAVVCLQGNIALKI